MLVTVIKVVIVLVLLRFTYLDDHTGIRYAILKMAKMEEKIKEYERYQNQGIVMEWGKNICCLIAASHFIWPLKMQDWRIYILGGMAILAFLLGMVLPKKVVSYPYDDTVVTPGGCIFVLGGGVLIFSSAGLIGVLRFWMFGGAVFVVLLVLYLATNFKGVKEKGVISLLAAEIVVLSLGLTTIASFHVGVKEDGVSAASVVNKTISAKAIRDVEVSDGEKTYHFVVGSDKWMSMPIGAEVEIVHYSSRLGFAWSVMGN